jgi:hypothetical protein
MKSLIPKVASFKNPYESNFGESARNAKISNAQAVEILKRARDGEPQSRIAREYGVSRNAIWNLLHGKSWSRVLTKALIKPHLGRA